MLVFFTIFKSIEPIQEIHNSNGLGTFEGLIVWRMLDKTSSNFETILAPLVMHTSKALR